MGKCFNEGSSMKYVEIPTLAFGRSSLLAHTFTVLGYPLRAPPPPPPPTPATYDAYVMYFANQSL